MELRSDLEDRHRFQTSREPEHITQDIAEAMHLSLDFIQSITDLDGDFERLVLPCLDLANRITYEMDTSKMGDPEAISTIKRLRRFQSVRMHQLRDRWRDLLQTAKEFDESATFRQLSDIVEYAEDSIMEAWLEARSFMSSCKEKLRYRLNDTFLADIFTSVPTQLPPIPQVIPTQSPRKRDLKYHLSDTFLHDIFASEPSQLPISHRKETPELAVQQQAPTVSRVNTMAICGAIAHHVKPSKEASPFETTLVRQNHNVNNNTPPRWALSGRDTPQSTIQAVFTVKPLNATSTTCAPP